MAHLLIAATTRNVLPVAARVFRYFKHGISDELTLSCTSPRRICRFVFCASVHMPPRERLDQGQAPDEHIDELLRAFRAAFSVIRRAYDVQGSTFAVVHAVASGCSECSSARSCMQGKAAQSVHSHTRNHAYRRQVIALLQTFAAEDDNSNSPSEFFIV